MDMIENMKYQVNIKNSENYEIYLNMTKFGIWLDFYKLQNK